MTVRELIEALKLEDQDAKVWMSSDSEGNSFSPMSHSYFSIGAMDGDGGGADFYDFQWSAADASMEEEEWNAFKEMSKKVLVLFP